MKELLVARDVRAYFKTVKGEEIKAVDGVSLTLSEGEVLGIAGESGCGKSTLSSVLSFTINPPLYLIEGEIRIDGQNALLMDKETLRRDVRGRYISVVPQGAMNALNPTIKIGSLIADVMQEHFPELKRDEALERARERVRALSLPERVLNLYPHQLSGGMKQRVIIVISTLLNPSVLI
ncbi:MAG TPA: ABC transporter ATP-binding protein, partial [Firmicutes bacterium]|nr:ABC transporter ATP-binding protein [Bacillota bacterium]